MRRSLRFEKRTTSRKIIAGLFTFFCAFHVRADEASVYIAQSGDTLSEVLYRKNLRPLYGKNGSLEAALKLNPSLAANAGNHIRPRQEIYLPENFLVSAAVSASESASESKSAAKSETLNSPPAIPPEQSLEQPREKSRDQASEKIADPAHQSHAEKKASAELAGDLYAGAEYAFNRLDAADATTGGQAEINSKSAYSLLVGWRTHWSETLYSYFQLESQFIEYQSSATVLKTIDNLSVNRTRLELGLEQTLSENSKIFYSLRYGQELFIRGVNSNLLHIDDVALPSIGGGFKYKLFEKADTYVSSDFQGQYIFGGSAETYTVNPGYLLSAALSLHQGPRLQTSLGVRERKQDTSLVNQTEKEVFGQVQFVWPFGGDAK